MCPGPPEPGKQNLNEVLLRLALTHHSLTSGVTLHDSRNLQSSLAKRVLQTHIPLAAQVSHSHPALAGCYSSHYYSTEPLQRFIRRKRLCFLHTQVKQSLHEKRLGSNNGEEMDHAGARVEGHPQSLRHYL